MFIRHDDISLDALDFEKKMTKRVTWLELVPWELQN